MQKPNVFSYRKYKDLEKAHEETVGQNIRLKLDNEALIKKNNALEHRVHELMEQLFKNKD